MVLARRGDKRQSQGVRRWTPACYERGGGLLHLGQVRILLPRAGGDPSLLRAPAGESGIDEGKKLGIDEGKVAEARRAVERVLRRRNLAVSEAQAAQLAACHDLDTLERWLDLAITAANAAEVFG